MIFIPFGPFAIWKLVLAVLVLLILVLPGIIWTIVALMIRQFVHLPPRLLELAAEGKGQVSDGAQALVASDQGIIRRTFSVLKSIAESKKALIGSKALMIESAALLRVVNPITLITAGVAFGAGWLIVLVTLLTALFQGVV